MASTWRSAWREAARRDTKNEALHQRSKHHRHRGHRRRCAARREGKLDGLWPAARALEAGEGFSGAATAARRGAEVTAEMKSARAGRSSHVPAEALSGVIDPGAAAFAAVFEALAGPQRT
ncbi:MAG: DAK2 domain-containing protein [Byssovorax sp.]